MMFINVASQALCLIRICVFNNFMVHLSKSISNIFKYVAKNDRAIIFNTVILVS